MTEFNYSASNITDDMLKESAVNIGKAWSDKIDQEMLKALAAMPRGHQMYLVAAPPAYESLKMHVEPLSPPDTPYRFMPYFDHAPMPLYGVPVFKSYLIDECVEDKPDPVVRQEEPVVEAVPAWQYWVAAAVFAVILSLLGNVL